MIQQKQITEIFQLWSKLPFSKLLVIDQSRGRFQVEFVLNTEYPSSNPFLKELQDLTVNKHPSGSVSWVGHHQIEEFGQLSGNFLGDGISSQYKKYRIDFIDASIKEEIDQEKLELYVEGLKKCVRRKVSVN